ncbi:type II secretion system protein GspM [Salinicola aestuarinus]|uniref:type II secretion system protein GspM n=1 Tax=Salinicola aestuarinus TaxID=1949082 RepID=UPI000DA21A06|nr:type II secretion system protein GspM [Salinicola aestuarinus]
MRALTSRERKIAALGGLALLVWLVWYVLVQLAFLAPLQDIRSAQSELRQQQQRYARFIARSDGLAEALAQSREHPERQTSLLPGSDPNAVAADLTQRVLERVRRHADEGPGCEVTQRRPIAAASAAPGEPYRPVKASLTLACAIEPLAHVLHDLEYGHPSLFIDEASIHRRDAAAAGEGPGRLQVNLLVRGYLQAASEDDT